MKTSAKLAIVVSILTLLAFAGLIPLGQWHDEYLTLHDYQRAGLVFFRDRLLHWSPRPLSELLVYVYAQAVHQAGLPLTGVFVAPFWILLVAAVLWPVLAGRQGLLPACVLLAMLLLGHPLAEVFYWPLGVVAYLPTLAAAAMLLALDWGGWAERPAGEICRFAALTVAAASSEVGALFAAIYIGLLVASVGPGKDRRRALAAIPLLLSLVVLYLQFSGRVARGGEVFGNPEVAHHPWNTMRYVAKHVSFDLLRNDNRRHATALLAGIGTKLLFLVGIHWAVSAQGQRTASVQAQRMRLVLMASALATAVLILAASLYNFGSSCCERHDTMRQGYVLIALGSLATYLAVRSPSRHAGRAGRVLLLALLIPLVSALPDLAWEYRHYADVRHAGSATWQSGRAAGPAMHVTLGPPGPVTGGLHAEPGAYDRASTATGDVQWMLTFFGKQTAVVESLPDAPAHPHDPPRDGQP